MNDTPAILDEIKEELETLCDSVNWECSKAEDPAHLYDIMFQSHSRGVVCVVYSGETLHQQVCRNAVSKMKFGIAVSTRRDLTNSLAYKIGRGENNTSLLQMVEKVKGVVLAMDVSNGLSDQNPKLEGVAAISLPDGIPLDCYQVNFWAYVVNQPDQNALEVSGGYTGVAGTYLPTGTETVNGVEFAKWEKGTYAIRADWSENVFKWIIWNGEIAMYWVSTNATPVIKPIGLTFNVNTPYYPAPTIA